MIELINVTKQYDDITALKNISLEVVKGEVFSVIGPNGSGKTTLLRIMAGIDVPTKGTISRRRVPLSLMVRKWMEKTSLSSDEEVPWSFRIPRYSTQPCMGTLPTVLN
jgi:ABC-type multidrug transport system ATPase subunit